MGFNPSQQKAIDARGVATVVSAAAGSGKTTVLIERIIRMILNGECTVDELLVVTFTRAATAEIRSRLAIAISKAIAEHPEDKNLKKQQMLVPSANVYTIDAFCGNLIRENFEKAGVAPDFKMVDESQQKVYQKEALKATLEKYYLENDESFSALNMILGQDLSKVVSKIYDDSQSYKNPSEIIDSSIEYYENPEKAIELAISNFNDYANYILEGLKKSSECITLDEAKQPFTDILNAFTQCKDLINERKFDEAFDLAESFEVAALSRKKFDGKDSVEYEQAKYYRETAKKFFEKEGLRKYFGTNLEYIKLDNEVQLPALKKLIEIVKDYELQYKKIKAEKNCLDFSDIKHIAYDLISNDEQLCKDIGSAYKHILIDEYQDTDELQDAIFSAISDNEKNLFVVGDVKQSIYVFRNAMPELFLHKKETYPGTIILGENYRSNTGIIDFVNFVFSKIMTKTCGDIDYKEKEEQLIAGKENQKPMDKEVELHVFQGNKSDSAVMEASFIVKYIREEMAKDEELKYSDFAILMRGIANGRGQSYADVLTSANIPVIFDDGKDFFETKDIKVIVSLLHAIDNPLLDIHLLAALMSPIFGLTADEVASLRDPKKHLYINLIESEDPKVKEILNTINKYRRLSISMPVGELIRQIYDDTLFPEIVAAMPNGMQRQANLFLLRDYAEDYENANEFGIAGFVRHLDTLLENDLSMQTASLITSTTDAVKLMTIHKSKGLQFKHVLLPDLGHSKSGGGSTYTLGKGLKLGINACDPKAGAKYPSFIKKAIENKDTFRNFSEELRILYVAMTRAEEKLVLLGTIGTKLVPQTGLSDLLPYTVTNSKNTLCLLLAAVDNYSHEKFFYEEHTGDIEEYEELEIPELSTDIDEEMLKVIKERLDYEYPYLSLSKIPTKRSASATEVTGFNPQFFATAKPTFLKDEKLTPTQKGTCLHRFMQFCDFNNAKQNPNSELENLKAKQYFTDIEASAIDLNKIQTFFSSSIYERIENSSNVMREKKFAVLIPAELFTEERSEIIKNETVLIQGIADCVFEEDDQIVILDYKTDRGVDEEALIARYTDQLRTYREALKRVLDKPVKATYIYSFSLDKIIEVP